MGGIVFHMWMVVRQKKLIMILADAVLYKHEIKKRGRTTRKKERNMAEAEMIGLLLLLSSFVNYYLIWWYWWMVDAEC